MRTNWPARPASPEGRLAVVGATCATEEAAAEGDMELDAAMLEVTEIAWKAVAGLEQTGKQRRARTRENARANGFGVGGTAEDDNRLDADADAGTM